MFPPPRLLVVCQHYWQRALRRRWVPPDATTSDFQALDAPGSRVRLRVIKQRGGRGRGLIYVSDSTRHYSIEDWKSDLIAHTRSGRLLRRSPDGTVTTLLDGLAFANGVALTADGEQVCVAETALARVQRMTMDGSELVAMTGLPGYPDNIALGSVGVVWVTIASPPDPTLTLLQGGGARLRPAALRLPEPLKPAPKRLARVIAYDSTGRLVHDLSADATDWRMATSVRESDGRVAGLAGQVQVSDLPDHRTRRREPTQVSRSGRRTSKGSEHVPKVRSRRGAFS